MILLHDFYYRFYQGGYMDSFSFWPTQQTRYVEPMLAYVGPKSQTVFDNFSVITTI